MNKLIIVLILLAGISCKSQKNTNSEDLTACNTLATVKDFTGLDGCRFLLVLENGEKWMVVKKGNIDWTFKDQQNIRFGYKELEPMPSVCMAEQKMIELTCIELVSKEEKPIIPECYRTKDPLSVDWMKALLREYEVEKVIRYPYSDNFAYLFLTAEKSYIYDCQGFKVCEVQGEDLSQCKRTIEGKDEGIIIWEALGRED